MWKLVDKEVILLLGFTGAGKSTTIHFLAGSHMTRVTTEEGFPHINTETASEDLANVTCSAKPVSETRTIAAVPVDCRMVGAKSRGTITLCDTPGFGDTQGIEMEISNGLGITRAIKSCALVKPVLLISSLEDKCAQIKSLAGVLADFIVDMKATIPSFEYIFTKFTKGQDEAIIKNKIDIVCKDWSKNAAIDPVALQVLKDMREKTRRRVFILDPVHDNPGELLDYLRTTQRVEEPSDAFRNFVANNAQHQLNRMVESAAAGVRFSLHRRDPVRLQVLLM